jgi:hypothetical protein
MTWEKMNTALTKKKVLFKQGRNLVAQSCAHFENKIVQLLNK